MSWSDRFKQIKTIDAHTAGEPLRLIVDGLPEIHGRTILEKRAYMRENLDWIRTALMYEPRGHADMYGCILTEPETEDGDLGVLFLHNEGYSTMCGHGVIALVTIALEAGLVRATGAEVLLKLDTPAGRVTATGLMKDGRVEAVSFLNVPSFVLKKGIRTSGGASFDIAFGGAYYAVGPASSVGLDVQPDQVDSLIAKGREVKRSIMETERIAHPFQEDLSFLYGVIFTGPASSEKAHSRNVCIFADGEVDRSPTGTGVSARAAMLYDAGEIGLNRPIVIESILGTSFEVEVAEETTFGPHQAVVPRVQGSAFITGEHTFLIDPEDPLKEGFLLR